MNWSIILDSPIILGAAAGIVALIAFIPALFIGRAWGISMASDVLKRRLRDTSAKNVTLSERNNFLEEQNADLKDRHRTIVAYAKRVGDRFTELAYQPTLLERNKKRMA